MPNINPKEPGDNFYPKYAVPETPPVSAIQIVKGRLYTKGGSVPAGNQLIAVTATGFQNGIYQASEAIDTAGTAGQHNMQCWTTRSRIGLIAKTANMHSGQVIQYDIAEHKVEPWAPTANGVTANQANLVCGRIYKIYSQTDITVEKDVTAVDDVVIVDLGLAI